MGLTVFSIFLVVLVTAIFVVVIGKYNKLIIKDKLTEEGFYGVDVQLKRRYDLIPNLVNVVKGYAKHEDSLLKSVTQLRGVTQGASDKDADQSAISHSLKSLFAVVENYPELKADKSFMQLQDSLNKIEENIQDARRYYNATVRDYNTYINSFPISILANIFNYKDKQYAGVDEDIERRNVTVEI